MANRRYNPRRAKSLHNFTISEAADLYGVHRNTVRHWLADGLKPLDNRKPIIIHGTALNDFHRSRRHAVRQACGHCEVYCFACRAPRRPAGAIADFSPITPKVGALSALCSVCGGMMTQRINAEKLKRFLSEVEVSIRPPPEPIEESH